MTDEPTRRARIIQAVPLIKEQALTATQIQARAGIALIDTVCKTLQRMVVAGQVQRLKRSDEPHHHWRYWIDPQLHLGHRVQVYQATASADEDIDCKTCHRWLTVSERAARKAAGLK